MPSLSSGGGSYYFTGVATFHNFLMIYSLGPGYEKPVPLDENENGVCFFMLLVLSIRLILSK